MQIEKVINFIQTTFNSKEFIPLHSPYFGGNEKKYINETIDSTFVSSVGAFVNLFEEKLAEYTGSKYAIACVNGTSALHTALLVCGVEAGNEVLTQALTFIATANAISYINAKPVFIDVDRDTLGMSPSALKNFLSERAIRKEDGFTYNKITGKKITVCMPMHTFGFPCRIDEIAKVCDDWNITLIEDAAESLGSIYNNNHTGVFGRIGTFSFNGNKTITCGGGGALITDDEKLARRAKHLTTQAKQAHPWRFIHDEIGYNYRMPNLNAALACAQLEQLEQVISNKRELSQMYQLFFEKSQIKFVTEISGARANYWLNTILVDSGEERDVFLKKTNQNNIMTRPVWDLMNTLPMFEDCQTDGLDNSRWLAERIINLPSSFRK